MQDFVSKGTGNSRFLKSVSTFLADYPTYEDFAAALVAGTLPVDFNGVNDSGIDQLGTPYNKASVLTDATATKIGLTSSATPNAAFDALADGVGNAATKNSVLTSATAGKLGLSSTATGDDAFSKLADATNYYQGSWTGNGTYGSSHKITIKAGSFVYVFREEHYEPAQIPFCCGILLPGNTARRTGFSLYTDGVYKLKLDNTSNGMFSFYSTESAKAQMNESNVKYSYLVLPLGIWNYIY